MRLFPWLRTHKTAPPHHNIGLMPARFLPLLYFGFAHLCLLVALLILASDADGMGAAFYQPRMLAVVHLVTLGFLSAAILGSVYLVGPLALRMPLVPSRLDHAAFLAFALGVLGMIGVCHALQALIYLVLTTGLGLWLAWSPPSAASGRWAFVYGVFAFLGFLGQMVVGVASRLLPLGFWLWGFADRNFRMPMPPLHGSSCYALQVAVFALWTGGVPALAAGLGLTLPWLTRVGAGSLALATLANALSTAVMLVRLWERPAAEAGPA